MLNDRNQKTVRIPFVVQKGELRFFHDPERKLELREEAIGELVLKAEALTDRIWGEALQAECKICIAHAGDTVLLEMKLGHQSWDFGEELVDRDGNPWNEHGESYARVILKGPLFLFLRGEKKARLSGCECLLPTLLDAKNRPRTAISLNQSYTFLSERYEPQRKSHTGNIFSVGRLRHQDCDHFLDMEGLRFRHTLQHEVQRREMAVAQKTLPGMDKPRRLGR